MTGDELRAKRMELQLYQASMAAQLQALGLELPGGMKIDQPALSQMERGRIPIPDEVAAAIAGGTVTPGADAPPPVGGAGGGRSSGGGGGQRKPRSRVRRKDAAADAQQPGAGGAQPSPAAAPPTPPAPEPEAAPQPPRPEPEPQRDRPPVPPVGGGTIVPPSSWDVAAKTQLESDLRAMFAGQTFLVPVRVGTGVVGEDGTEVHEIRHHEGFIPGIAQLVGAANTYDGEVIAAHAASMAHAWAELADENPTVRRFLMGMTYGGAWRGVVAATLPVVLAIAANHGMGMPGFLGGTAAAPVSLEP